MVVPITIVLPPYYSTQLEKAVPKTASELIQEGKMSIAEGTAHETDAYSQLVSDRVGTKEFDLAWIYANKIPNIAAKNAACLEIVRKRLEAKQFFPAYLNAQTIQDIATKNIAFYDIVSMDLDNKEFSFARDHADEISDVALKSKALYNLVCKELEENAFVFANSDMRKIPDKSIRKEAISVIERAAKKELKAYEQQMPSLSEIADQSNVVFLKAMCDLSRAASLP
jgi:hypothetical protein